ncbi:TPA: hypothetical protein ON737_003728, partial [Morganella morganii]|nr:hypothetical protein [Morganella morganii]
LLSEINKLMHEQYVLRGKSYSILYFSDHGLAHRDWYNVITLDQGKQSSFHYDIPLFKTSSDDNRRHECNSFKSGLNFTNGIASWIGIKNIKLDKNYDLFNCIDDPNDFGLKKRINSSANENISSIDITGK